MPERDACNGFEVLEWNMKDRGSRDVPAAGHDPRCAERNPATFHRLQRSRRLKASSSCGVHRVPDVTRQPVMGRGSHPGRCGFWL